MAVCKRGKKMKQKIEVLKIAKFYYSKLKKEYSAETETLGFFTSEEKTHRAIRKLGLEPEDFNYLEYGFGIIPDDSFGIVLDKTNDSKIIIYCETYDLNDFTPSNIWEEYCDENGLLTNNQNLEHH